MDVKKKWRGGGVRGGGGCDRRIEVFEVLVWVGGVRVDVNEELKFL